MGQGFLEGVGRDFPQHDVVIIHDRGGQGETRTPSRAIVQAKTGTFNVDAPIYEGDYVEVADPRGGTREHYVAGVDVTDTGGAAAFAGMGHISAHWGRPPQEPPARTTYNAPVVIVNGDHAQVAFGNQSVTQNAQPVAAGYDELAKAIGAVLERIDQLDPDDRELAAESGREVLTELVKAEPDRSVLKRGVTHLRGVLAPLVTPAVAGAGEGLATWAQTMIEGLTV